jgi:hypothetical protein
MTQAQQKDTDKESDEPGSYNPQDQAEEVRRVKVTLQKGDTISSNRHESRSPKVHLTAVPKKDIDSESCDASDQAEDGEKHDIAFRKSGKDQKK